MAEYLILEPNHVTGLDALYQHPGSLPGLDYLEKIGENVYLYRIAMRQIDLRFIVKRIIKIFFVKQNILLAITACLAIAAYLLASAFTRVIGFPLDDAWIHQTYARNSCRTWAVGLHSGQIICRVDCSTVVVVDCSRISLPHNSLWLDIFSWWDQLAGDWVIGRGLSARHFLTSDLAFPGWGSS